MKASRFLFLVCSVAIVAGLIFLIQQTSVRGQEGHEQEYVIRKPPASLDKYYPPEAEGPQYLFAMFAVEGPLMGFMTHLQGGDMAKAKEYFETFKAEYKRVAEMVPEWRVHYWPDEPVNNLEAALGSGNPAAVGPAVGALMQSCTRCHNETMSAVWARYQKPLAELGEFMFDLVGPMGAVNTYTAEGEFGKARGAFGLFQERMDELAESCGSCHDTERAYYVSADVQALMKTVADALEAEAPNAEKILGTMQKIGAENCYKCHKVHIPISNIQKAWAGPGAH
ncbi:hypothetical protein ACFL6S_23350 [Candidatus Poribacteria bacterium]